MPRVNGIMQVLPGSYGVPNRPIESAKYNTQLDDLVADANAARPTTAGGTGANNAVDALKNLGGTPKADIDKAIADATSPLLKRAGDTMTGALSFTPGALPVLTGGTRAIDYATGNRRRLELRSGANTLNVTNVPESGGDLEIDILFTGGTLAFSQTIRWKIGGGEESTAFADTGVTLTAGRRYAVVIWDMGGTLYGVIG